MGYWTSLARALLGRGPDAKTNPTRPRPAASAASAYPGTGLRFNPPGAGYDHWRDVGDFRRNAVVAICVNWLSRQFLQAQLRLGRRRADGTYEEVRGPRGSAHPLVHLLTRWPNPFLSARQLWAGAIADYLPYGQAFLLQARSLDGDGPPAELYWLPARRVEVRASDDPDRPVECYRYYNGLAWDDYSPDDVLHLRDNPDDDNPVLGRGRGAEQVRSVAALNNGERYTGSVLRNAHAGKLLVPKDAPLSLDSLAGSDDDEARAAQRRRARLNLAGESAGSIDVALRPLDVLDLGLGPEQMALDRVLDRPEALVVAAFGLNAMALDLPGSERTRTYANKAEARREAWENGVIPLQDAILDDLNHRLVPEFDDSGTLELWWDRSDVSALREDANARASRASALFQATLVDRDTARDLAGLEPLGDDDPNGDLYHGQELVGDDEEAPGDDEEIVDGADDARRDSREIDAADGVSEEESVKARSSRGRRGMRRSAGGRASGEAGRSVGGRGPLANVPGNCGTGHGGFQRGNRCALGGRKPKNRKVRRRRAARSAPSEGGPIGHVGRRADAPRYVTLRSGEGPDQAAPRSPGPPRRVTTTDELLASPRMPGVRGVVLDQRVVRFADIYKISVRDNVEYVLTREDGRFILRSGLENRALIPRGVRPIIHTQPPDATGFIDKLPSISDLNVLNHLWSLDPNGPRPFSRIIWGEGPGDSTVFWAVGIDQIPKPRTEKRRHVKSREGTRPAPARDRPAGAIPMKSTEEYLLEVGPLEHFFILRTPATQPGLITWVDLDGQAYFLTVKDDRLDECLEFLESRGCPVVDDPHQVDTVARRLIAGLEP